MTLVAGTRSDNAIVSNNVLGSIYRVGDTYYTYNVHSESPDEVLRTLHARAATDAVEKFRDQPDDRQITLLGDLVAAGAMDIAVAVVQSFAPADVDAAAHLMAGIRTKWTTPLFLLLDDEQGGPSRYRRVDRDHEPRRRHAHVAGHANGGAGNRRVPPCATTDTSCTSQRG